VDGCPRCGQANPPGSRFCNGCGAALDGEPAAAPSRFETPAAYTPRHLARKILASREALPGERKQVTVLFADMKGSMEILADRDPEEARRLLDPVLERMMEAVHRYEGTVNQVMGDGIMALFGAPVAHEDHAVRACFAALGIQEAIRRYSREARRAHGVEVQVRVGLHSGAVVVRTIGSDLRMDYSAVGQTTHLAARMEQLAPPGAIRLTADTLRLAEGYVQVAPLGPVPVKGLAAPVEVFELVGAVAGRTRLQAAAARGLTRFVGREAELDRLGQALEEAGAGRGQVVAVVGEAGVGKSRLFREALHSHRTAGWLVLEAASVSYGKATPYQPVTDLLRAYARVDPGVEARVIREKVTGKLLALDEALRPVLPPVLQLLDADGGTAGNAPGGERRRLEVAEAVKRVLLRESLEQPVAVVLEDLHWVDADTQAVLDVLVAALPASRLLLLVNYRPEYRHGWGSRSGYTQLRLEPLRAESAEELLRALLGEDPSLGPVKRLLVSRTAGNPFFLEESVRSLVEVGALAGGRGAYRLERPPEHLEVPATVQALLASRIDRLGPEDKALLQTAAAVGKDVPLALLRAVAGLEDEALHLGLGRLEAGEFLDEAAAFPEVEYTFRHALTLEVAYGSLLQERRRALHAAVVEAFERLWPERVAERAAWLAQHAFRGEVWDKALAHLRRTASGSPDAADVVGSPESPGQLWWSGEHERAVKAAERDLAVAAGFRNFGLQVTASLRLGQVMHSLGQYARAVEVLARAAGWLEGDLRGESLGAAGLPSVLALTWLALALAEQGDFDQALARAGEAASIAEEADHAYSLVVACAGLGSVRLLRGQAPVDVLERGLVLVQLHDIPALFPLVAGPLGLAYAYAGRATDGVPRLERAVEQAAAMKLQANQPWRLARLAEALLIGGRTDRAAEASGRALDLARSLGERGHEAHAWRVAAEAAAASRREIEAASAYREAISLAGDLGQRPLLLQCRLGLAALQADARALAQARREAEALGMTPWPGSGPTGGA
jgi:class 3 adenylate cyclase/tetratricopeptide (TPR) repeat protein